VASLCKRPAPASPSAKLDSTVSRLLSEAAAVLGKRAFDEVAEACASDGAYRRWIDAAKVVVILSVTVLVTTRSLNSSATVIDPGIVLINTTVVPPMDSFNLSMLAPADVVKIPSFTFACNSIHLRGS
jgi:hypothetical protein